MATAALFVYGGDFVDSIQKLYLLEQHLSQKELARRLGVTPATVRNWKKQEQIPKQEQITKLNRVFGANKRYISDNTTNRANRKRREQDLKFAFEIRSHKAANLSRFIEEKRVKKKFQASIGNKRAFVSADGEQAQIMSAEDTGTGIKAGIGIFRIYGVIRVYIDTKGTYFDDYKEYRIPIDIKKDLDFEEALAYMEDIFLSKPIPKERKGLTPVPYQFLGYEIESHRPKQKQKNKRKK